MVCIGTGPGPKNVLVEFEDGSKTVVPYAIWKHKLSQQQEPSGGSLSDKTYATVAGFIQFDVKERDVNGKNVRDVVVKAIGSQKLVRITVWPEHASVSLDKGDFLVADGVFTQSMGQAQDGSPREYLNLSASTLLSLPSATKSEREVVTSSNSSAGGSDNIPF